MAIEDERCTLWLRNMKIVTSTHASHARNKKEEILKAIVESEALFDATTDEIAALNTDFSIIQRKLKDIKNRRVTMKRGASALELKYKKEILELESMHSKNCASFSGKMKTKESELYAKLKAVRTRVINEVENDYKRRVKEEANRYNTDVTSIKETADKRLIQAKTLLIKKYGDDLHIIASDQESKNRRRFHVASSLTTQLKTSKNELLRLNERISNLDLVDKVKVENEERIIRELLPRVLDMGENLKQMWTDRDINDESVVST